MIHRFGVYELDEDAGELRRQGKLVPIQPRPFELLRLLLRERERVVPADELFAALWPGVAMAPGSLTRAVSVARRAIGDTHRGEWIQAVAKRGYRFVGEVQSFDPAAARGAAPAPPRERAAPGRAAPRGVALVGREAELARLRAAWDAAAAGAGGVAIVSGPPGIGKTRLADALAAEVAARGPRVLVGRGRDGEGVPPFWIFAEVLRQLLAEEPGEDAGAGELADLLGELSGSGSGAGAAARRPERAPEQSRFLFFEAVARALARASQRWPLLVVLEDVQWAGAASLRLLEHLAVELASAPVLLLATVRDEAAGADRAPLERTLALLRRQARCCDVAVGSFSRGDVAALLEAAIGRPPPPDLTSELVARTEGVPLFLREAIRLLSERGDLREPERVRRWAVTLPDHLLDLIRRPLARLSERSAELLGAAAVMGREFPLPLVASAAGIPRDEALDLLDEAEAAGVVEPVRDSAATWRFGHALHREAVYESLAAEPRARLHARVAEALERQYGEDADAVIAELAHHHHQALAVGGAERAFACAVRAAEWARRLYAYEQSAMHWEQALAALGQSGEAAPERRFEVLLRLGEAHALAGARPRRREAFAEAIALARQLGREEDAARAAVGFCDLSEWAPQDEEARAVLEDALRALGEGGAPQRARLLTRLGYLDALGQPAAAEPRLRSAAALAREAGDAEALAEALYVLHFVISGPDHVAERAELVGELLAGDFGAGRSDAPVILLLDAASDRLLVGDAAGAARRREEAAAAAGPSPHPGLLWHLRAFDAGFALLEGRFADAERLTGEAFPIGVRIEHPYASPVHRGHRALLACDRGEIAEVFRWFDPARSPKRGAQQWTTAFVARALAATGRTDEARARLEALTAKLERLPRNMRWTGTLVEIAHLCADLGDAERAAALVAQLAPVEGQHAVMALPICYGGPVTRALARLYALQGRLGEASELFEEARASVESLGARPMQARIQVEHGSLLARRGSRGPAREQLAAGAALAAELGMRALEAAAREALARAA